MSESLSRLRSQLKAKWIAANQRALRFRKKMDEAEKEASALLRVLDTMDKAAPESIGGDNGKRRSGRREATQARIMDLISNRGPLTAREISNELEIAYPTAINHLNDGPFRQQVQAVGRGGAKRWELVHHPE